MFANNLPHRGDEDQKDIFAPVADLMVGVVFIFIILILALSLDLSTEKSVPQSTYDAKVQENLKLQQQIDALTAALQQERTRRTGAEQTVSDQATRLKEQARRLAETQQQVDTLSAEKARLVEFVRFVRDSQIQPLMRRLSQADQTRTKILTDMEARLASQAVDVKVDPTAGTLMLPSSKLFSLGQADPTVPEGRDTILHVGQVMSDVLPCYSPRQAGSPVPDGCSDVGDFSSLGAVYVEGHTDVAAFGTTTGRFRNNWDLSAGRAIEAFTLIRDHYPALSTLKNQDGDAILGVSGYADTRPALKDAVDRNLPAVAERDRRIEIRLIMSTNQELVGAVLKQFKDRLEGVDGLIH